MLEFLQSLDIALFRLINGQLAHPFMDPFFAFVSRQNNFVIPILILVLLLLVRGSNETRIRVLVFGLTLASADLLGVFFKDLIVRDRPYFFFEAGVVREIAGLGVRGSSPSFPSNHAINSTAMAVFAFMWLRELKVKWAPAVLLIPLAVGYSRIYGGAHFPTDVLGGALIGGAVGVGGFLLHKHMPVMKLRNDRVHGVDPLAGALWLAIFLTILRFSFVTQGYMSLAPEEAQYWEWSRNLDWSYYSKPPMIAYLIRATTMLLGNTELGVRAGALLISIAMMLITWKICMRLFKDARVASVAIVWINVMPLFGVGAVILTTDTPMMLFWSLAVLFLVMALFENKAWAWYAAGAAIGLGCLSKYAMVYMIPLVFLFLALARDHRHWLRRPEPYLSILIAILLFTPVIYWNWANDWVSVRHVDRLARAGGSEESLIRFDTILEFAGGQIGIVTPLLFGIMAWGTWVRIRRDGLAMDPRVLFLLCLSATIFLAFLIRSPFAKTYANWIAMTYYTWAIFAAWQIVAWYDAAGSTHRRRRVGFFGLATGILAISVTLLATFPAPVRGLIKTIDNAGIKTTPKMDPHFQLLGGRQIGSVVTNQVQFLPGEKEGKVFFFARRYQDAARGAFYTEGQPRFYNPNLGRRMNQYDLWPQIGPEHIGWDAIFVEDRVREERKAPPEPVVEAFDRWHGPFIARVQVGDVIYHDYPVYRLEGYNGQPIGRDEASRY